jgi:hypothetical protein
MSGASVERNAADATVTAVASRITDGAPEGAPSSANSVSFAGIVLVKHTPATGGLLVVRDKDGVRLTPIQFDLLALLLKQSAADKCAHELVRGFVSSYELLCSLAWHTAHPDIGHLKQLVRRVRRRVRTTGVVVQSRSGLGYRLVLSA